VAGLARAIAAGAGAIVVAPSVGSNPASPSGCWINGRALHRGVARLFGDCFGALQASADAAADDAAVARISLPREFVLAGHSAGGNLAVSAAGLTTVVTLDGRTGSPAVVTSLRGVVLLDAVDQGGSMQAGLERLRVDHHRPVRTVAAEDSRWNAAGRGTTLLRRARPGEFVGVRLAGGTHIDAEGDDAGRLVRLACGTPRPENVSALRSLAAGWIGDLLTGVETPAFLAATTAGTVTVLPDGGVATTL
jgi:hypothetical protein